MGKKFKMAKSIVVLIRAMDFEHRRGVGRQARLPRNAELFGKAGMDCADGFKTEFRHSIVLEKVDCFRVSVGDSGLKRDYLQGKGVNPEL